MPHHRFRRIHASKPHLIRAVNCAFQFCGGPASAPPPPAAANSDTNLDAANSNLTTSAAEGVPDPTQRNPTIALNDYSQRIRVETTLGVVFVVVLVCVAIALWIGLDKQLRRRLVRYARAAGACCVGRRKDQAREEDEKHSAQAGARPHPRPQPGRRSQVGPTRHSGQAAKTMPLGPPREMRVMPCVLEAKNASMSSGGSSTLSGSTLSEKKSTSEETRNLPVLQSVS